MESGAIDYQTQHLLHWPQAITHTERPRQTESSTIYHIPQQSISHTPIQSIQHTQPPSLQYDQSHAISHIPQAINHGPVHTAYFCLVCKTYFSTLEQLHKHMERFHDELRQEDRGIKRRGLKDSDEHVRKRNKVMGNEVEMYGEGYKNNYLESDNESNTFSEEYND